VGLAKAINRISGTMAFHVVVAGKMNHPDFQKAKACAEVIIS